MLLYFSGFNSTYKPYIPEALQCIYTGQVVNYVLTNVYSQDRAKIIELITHSPTQVTFVGHSTGGFHALHMIVSQANIASAHLINPALNLTTILKDNPLAQNMLLEADLIDQDQAHIEHLLHPSHHLSLQSGQFDDRIDMPFHEALFRATPHAKYRYEIGHRFTSAEFDVILGDVGREVD